MTRGRDEPSLDDAKAKLARAKLHSECFNKAHEEVTNGHVYLFGVDIYDGGRTHLYWADHPPATDPRFALIAGDCVHNLRSALDHLAWELVRVSGKKQPNRTTQFPARQHQPFSRSWCGLRRSAERADIRPGIGDKVREIVDSVQPYKGTPTGKRLAILCDLDAIDKHHHLLVDAAIAPMAGSGGYQVGVDPEPRMQLLDTRLTKHRKPVLKVTYDRPRPERNPDLTITPWIMFEGGPTGPKKRTVSGVLADLCILVEDEIFPMFERFF